MNIRRRYRPGKAATPAIPGGNVSEAWTTPDYGAATVEQIRSIPREGEDSLAFHAVPITFDLVNIIPSPGDGATVQLVGPLSTAAVQLGQAPRDFRNIVDGIFPYLEGNAGGALVGPRIPGTNVNIVWSVRVSGQGAGSYGSINTILTPWNGMADRPLFDIQPGQVLTVDVTIKDPLGMYAWVGVRIKGRLIPWKAEARK